MITNDNIYEHSRHLKVIKDDMVRNSSGRLFQYFGVVQIIHQIIVKYCN